MDSPEGVGSGARRRRERWCALGGRERIYGSRSGRSTQPNANLRMGNRLIQTQPGSLSPNQWTSLDPQTHGCPGLKAGASVQFSSAMSQ